MSSDIAKFSSGGLPDSPARGLSGWRDDRRVAKAASAKGADLAIASALDTGTALEIQAIASIGQQTAAGIAQREFNAVSGLYAQMAADVNAGRVPDWLAAESFARGKRQIEEVSDTAVEVVQKTVRSLGAEALSQHGRLSAKYRR